MTTIFTQTGGIRTSGGTVSFGVFNATWPFARLTATPEKLDIKCFTARYSFPKGSIRKLTMHRELFSKGLRIQHSVKDCPDFLVFWTFSWKSLKSHLQEMGYEVDDN